MPKTIGNPLSWGVDAVGAAGKHISSVAETVGSEHDAQIAPMPEVRRIDYDDLQTALRGGFRDFLEARSDVAFLVLLYPVIGLVMSWIAFNRELFPLIFPVMSGFALLGPVAAVGVYEISRKREAGENVGWLDAFGVLKSPSFGAIFVLGLFLFAAFVVWLMAAHGIWAATLGPEPPASIGAFLGEVFGTPAGWTMILVGCGVGLLFAAAVLAVSVVSFPLLLDRDVGLPVAVVTSIRAASLSPGPIAVWGLIVAGLLALGSIPFFLGLIVVLPVLGHATWRLYRMVVAPA